MVAIALFILLGFLALYLSSQSLFDNLQKLNQDNNILNITSQTLESLNSAELRSSEVLSNSNLNNLRYKFEENLKVTEQLIKNCMKLSRDKNDVSALFNKISDSLRNFRSTTELILVHLQSMEKEKSKKEIEEVSADILTSRQYLIDAREQLIQAQIMVKKDNDRVFNAIYKNRYKPLIVAVFLSTMFFTFVLTFGLSISKKIDRSISRLLRATDKVAQGKMDYQAKILEQDEIGRLTDAFNKMISSLKKGRQQLNEAVSRTSKLQEITAAFSEALTPNQVYDVIFTKAFQFLNAEKGLIVLLSENGNSLDIKRAIGIDEAIINKWNYFSLDAKVPVTESIKFAKPIFLSTEDILEYEDIDTDYYVGKQNIHAYLPLVIGSQVLGSLIFIFKNHESFGDDEKEFIFALAQLCAQALHRSQLYEDAKKAIEARDEFLSIASHELRTPLTPLKLQLQGLERHVDRGTLKELPEEKIRKIVQTSDKQINRLANLIDDLLDVSRITTGKLSLNRETFSMKEMIDEVLVQYSQHLQNAKTNVDVKVLDDMTGNWDKVRIEQVVINLLTNAAKYAPNKPIHVTLNKKHDNAVIEVRDEGPGIAPEDQERIFKRFERVHSKNNVGGLGLGLYISKQIVDAHKGKLTVESNLGHGSIFRVELPQEIHV